MAPVTPHARVAARRRRLRRTSPLLAGVAALSFVTTSCTHVPIPGTQCKLFPYDSVWRAKAYGLPVHPKSADWKITEQRNPQPPNQQLVRKLKADFGAGLWDGGPIGIPYNVVAGNAAKRTVSFDEPDESDLVGYPIPNPPNLEGGVSNPANDGDRHVLMLDKDNCRLYETYYTWPGAGNSWTTGITAFSGATWDLNSNAMRTDTYTSADAAGLPILPGLVRYEEVVEAQQVLHAIRVTVPITRTSYVWPASHQAGSTSSIDAPPMGAWLRLKSTVNVNSYDPYIRPILKALQIYGGIVADNGSALYMSGAPDDRWDNDKLALLGALSLNNDFEFVDASSLKVANNSYQATNAG